MHGLLNSTSASVSSVTQIPFVLLYNDHLLVSAVRHRADLADPAIFHEEEWWRAGLSHVVYFYDVGAHRIWGLTGRFVHTLLKLLPAAA